MTKKKSHPAANRLIVERLEPRVLFSADPLGLAVGAVLFDEQSPFEDSIHYEPFSSLAVPASEQPDNVTAVDLIFIDVRSETDKTSLKTLLAEEHSNAQIYIIDANNSGIDYVSQILAEQQSVSNIHFIAHGDNEGIRLGTDWLDNTSVTHFESQLTQWAQSLTNDADILFYSCNLTAGNDGLSLINQLATLTGADIAASSDVTGHAARNGDWNLESTTGFINTVSLGTERLAQEWLGSLDLINVDTQADSVDGNVSSVSALKLDPGGDGNISLREAVLAANNTIGADEIVLAGGTYHFDNGNNEDNALTGDLDIRDGLTITGSGSASTKLDAQNGDRIFDVFGVDLTLNDMTVEHGEAGQEGGGIRIVAATTTLNNVVIHHNETTNGNGGGIYIQDGNLVVNNSTFYHNTTNTNGAAIAVSGNATASITNSIFYENESDEDGGGVAFLNTGTSTVVGSHFYDNIAGDNGGGIYANSNTTISITSTTLATNSAVEGGGARLKGDSTINAATFSGNTASSNAAGLSVSTDSTTTVLHSTFTDNEVDGSDPNDADAIRVAANGTLNIGSTIIADNNADPRPELRIEGTLNSLGYNLLSDTFAEFDHPTDINSGNANLGALVSIGGLPPTHTPQAGSDAIDSGNNRDGVGEDANGATPNFYSDIGAVEASPATTGNKLFWVDTNGWIYRANEDGSGVQQIFQTSQIPQDIEYDPGSNRIFWTETDGDYGRIRSADINGGDLHETPLSTYGTGVLAPKGIAIDTTNRFFYVAIDRTDVNASALEPNRIDKYAINNDGSFIYDSTVKSDGFGRLLQPLMEEAIDLEYVANLDGRETLIWAEKGGPAGSIGPIPYGAIAPSMVLLDLATLDDSRVESPTGIEPAPISVDEATGVIYTADGVTTNSLVFDYDAPSVTAVSSNTTTDIFGLVHDPDNNLVWWTKTTGEIGYTNASLGGSNSVVNGGVGAPTAIALGHVPLLNTPAYVETNLGLTTVAQGGTAAIDQTMLLSVDDLDADTNIIYQVLATPSAGQLLLNSNPLAINETFTQEDINFSRLNYTHDDSEMLSDEFRFSVKDSVNDPFLASNTFAIAITPVNNFSPVAADENINVDEGSVATLLDDGTTSTLLANVTDADSGDTLSITLKPGFEPSYGSVAIDANTGAFSYTHDDSENMTDQFTYLVTDSGGLTDEGIATITVNPVNDNSPQANNDLITAIEGAAVSLLSNGNNSVLDNDTDADAGDTMAATIKPGNDVQHGVLLLASDGTFTYTHNGTENLTDQFTYILTDSGGITSEATVTINVTAVSDFDPVAVAETVIVDEADTISTLVGGATSVLANDTDADAGDTMAASVKPGNNVQHGALTLNPDGTFTYTHNGTENLIDQFTYIVTDADGRTDEIAVDITINPISDFDPVAVAETVIVDESDTTSILVGGATSVLANDTDADAGDTMAASIKPGSDVQHGALTLNPDGTFTYTHNGTENLIDQFTYIVTDADGRTDEIAVDITINPVNDFSPDAISDAINVNEAGTTSVLAVSGNTTLFHNDTDADVGDSMTASIKPGDNVSHGTLTLNPNGTFIYTHDGSENFTDQFTYVITDSGGLFDEAIVYITINPVSDNTPVANADAITTAEGGTAISLSDGVTTSVLTNDTDADINDSLSATIKSGFSTLHGTLTLNGDGSFLYIHDGSENFTDSFTYVTTDSSGDTSEAVVSITITQINDAPVFNGNPLTLSATEREPFTTTFPNDQFIDSEGNNWAIELNTTTGPLPEWLSFDAATRTLSGTPAGSDIGTVILTMQARDSEGGLSAVYTGLLVVSESSQADVITLANNQLSENTPGAIIGPLSLNGEIIDRTQNVAISDNRFDYANGMLVLSGENTIDYESENSINLTITTSDDIGDLVSDVVQLQIGNENDAPTLAQAPTDTMVPAVGTLELPDDVFVDQDTADTLQYTAQQADGSVLPAWLNFNAQELTFSLTGAAEETSLAVEITANDGNGGINTTVVNLQFDPPVLEPALPEVASFVPIAEETSEAEAEEPEPDVGEAIQQVTENVQHFNPGEDRANDVEDFEHIDIASLIKPLPKIALEAAVSIEDIFEQEEHETTEDTSKRININKFDIDFQTVRSLDSSFSSLADSFDEQRELLEEAYEQSRSAIGRSITLTSGLSVGYLLWLIRGGTLMGSVLSSMPAWRLVDPLPILGGLGEDFEESDDSLESIVDGTAN